jgi:hypothetical protein
MKRAVSGTGSRKERVHCLGLLLDLANVPDVSKRRDQHLEWVKQMRRRYSHEFGKCSQAEIIALCRLLRRVWTERSLPDKEWFLVVLRQFYAGIVRHTSLTTDESELLISQHESALAALDAIFRRPSREERTRGVLGFLRQQAVIDTFASEPKRTPFDDCLTFLLGRLRVLRQCQNKGCENQPYFVADKQGQKHCCETCAREVRLAGKRDWWNENRGKDSSKKGGKR